MVSIIVEILGSSLIALYAGNGCNNNAWCVFDKMSQKNCIAPLWGKLTFYTSVKSNPVKATLFLCCVSPLDRHFFILQCWIFLLK